MPQNKGKSSQQNKGSLAKTKARKRRQTVQKRRQRLAVGHWKFHDFLGACYHALQKKMSWRNGTSALVHQCDTHLKVAVASNFAPPYNFHEAGPNFGLPFSVVANLRTRFQNFHGARPFTPPCTEKRVDDVSSGSGEHCSVAACRFTFASQWARPIRCCRRKRKHDRKDGLSQLVELRDRHMPQRRSH